MSLRRAAAPGSFSSQTSSPRSKKGAIDVGKVTAVLTATATSPNGFEGADADTPCGFVLQLVVPGRTYHLKMATERVRDRWAHMLRAMCLGEVSSWNGIGAAFSLVPL